MNNVHYSSGLLSLERFFTFIQTIISIVMTLLAVLFCGVSMGRTTSSSLLSNDREESLDDDEDEESIFFHCPTHFCYELDSLTFSHKLDSLICSHFLTHFFYEPNSLTLSHKSNSLICSHYLTPFFYEPDSLTTFCLVLSFSLFDKTDSSTFSFRFLSYFLIELNLICVNLGPLDGRGGKLAFVVRVGFLYGELTNSFFLYNNSSCSLVSTIKKCLNWHGLMHVHHQIFSTHALV